MSGSSSEARHGGVRERASAAEHGAPLRNRQQSLSDAGGAEPPLRVPSNEIERPASAWGRWTCPRFAGHPAASSFDRGEYNTRGLEVHAGPQQEEERAHALSPGPRNGAGAVSAARIDPTAAGGRACGGAHQSDGRRQRNTELDGDPPGRPRLEVLVPATSSGGPVRSAAAGRPIGRPRRRGTYMKNVPDATRPSDRKVTARYGNRNAGTGSSTPCRPPSVRTRRERVSRASAPARPVPAARRQRPRPPPHARARDPGRAAGARVPCRAVPCRAVGPRVPLPPEPEPSPPSSSAFARRWRWRRVRPRRARATGWGAA